MLTIQDLLPTELVAVTTTSLQLSGEVLKVHQIFTLKHGFQLQGRNWELLQ